MNLTQRSDPNRLVVFRRAGRYSHHRQRKCTVPTYEYECDDPQRACERCRDGFEMLRRLADPPLTACPHCGAPVRKRFSLPSIGASQSSFDDKAKRGGFHKLKRLGKGEYEKQY